MDIAGKVVSVGSNTAHPDDGVRIVERLVCDEFGDHVPSGFMVQARVPGGEWCVIFRGSKRALKKFLQDNLHLVFPF